MRPTEFSDFVYRERRLSGPKPIKSVPSTQIRAASNDQEQIRYRAYGLYVQNGYRDGYAMDDWLRAEAEVRGQLLVSAVQFEHFEGKPVIRTTPSESH